MDNKRILESAKSFLYKNARLIDRRRYEYLFEDGSKQAVIDALKPYRNSDGGFGSGLEADIRCPYSQPVPTEMALAIMDETDCFDEDIFAGILRYLEKITLPEGGLPLVFQNVDDYPHAPWWGLGGDDAPSINPTGHIFGMLYKQRARTDIVDEDWFRRNVSFIWRFFEEERPEGYHDGIQWIHFLENTNEKEKAGSYWPKVDEWVNREGTIELNPDADGYVQKVLDWAPSSGSYARKFISDADLQKHLADLVSRQQEDGGWPISWEGISAGVELEWRGALTVERLKTLRSYGVI